VRLPKRKTRTSGDAERVTAPRKRSKITDDDFAPATNGDETSNGHAVSTGERRPSHLTLANRVKRQSSTTYRHVKSEDGATLVCCYIIYYIR
jgi:hypothetical protein